MLAAVLFLFNTLFWSLMLYPLIFLRALIPTNSVRQFCNKTLLKIGESWISWNDKNMAWTQDIEWDIRIEASLKYDESYMVCVNHQSWMDIVVLQHVLNRKIPFLRFFLKQELRYIPLLGGAWAALDYPFMKRYTKAHLEKYPEKKGEDLRTAKKALEKFRGKPVSILNFLEGTRFTVEKHRQQSPPYKYLLMPKAGGMASTLESLSGQISKILDVTIVYPEGAVSVWEAFNGRLRKVHVHVREISIPFSFQEGNYTENPEFREKVQAWVQELWRQKDNRIDALLSGA